MQNRCPLVKAFLNEQLADTLRSIHFELTGRGCHCKKQKIVDGILEMMSEGSREKDISGLLLRPYFRKYDIRRFLSLHKKRSGGAKRGGATKSDLVRQFVMEDLLREKDLASLSSPSVS